MNQEFVFRTRSVGAADPRNGAGRYVRFEEVVNARQKQTPPERASGRYVRFEELVKNAQKPASISVFGRYVRFEEFVRQRGHA